MSAGKGDSPRAVNGKKFRENFDLIRWNLTNKKNEVNCEESNESRDRKNSSAAQGS